MNLSINLWESKGIIFIVGRETGIPPCSFTIRIKLLLFFTPRVIAIVLLMKILRNIIMNYAYDKSI